MSDHDWKTDNLHGGHNGEYYYTCTKCGARDWIASYGTLSELCSDKPCIDHRIKDMIGNVIKVGDLAGWPTRFSSSLSMHVGTVTRVTKDRVDIEVYDGGDRKIKKMFTKMLDRVVVVKSP